MTQLPNPSLDSGLGNAVNYDLRTGDPPFLGHRPPLVKDTDPADQQLQMLPVYCSKQFRLWHPDDLTEYNKLAADLHLWRSVGWCEVSEMTEYVRAKENWIVWVRYSIMRQVSPDDMKRRLNDADPLKASYAP